MRKLDLNARPGEQKRALATLLMLTTPGVCDESLAAISAAGGIPAAVRMLGPGAGDAVRGLAASLLVDFAQNDDNKVAIAAAGAIPPLVQLLGPGCASWLHKNALKALCALAGNADNQVTIAAAAGILPLLVQLSGSKDADTVLAAAACVRALGADALAAFQPLMEERMASLRQELRAGNGPGRDPA